jgi:hypothetical protein
VATTTASIAAPSDAVPRGAGASAGAGAGASASAGAGAGAGAGAVGVDRGGGRCASVHAERARKGTTIARMG